MHLLRENFMARMLKATLVFLSICIFIFILAFVRVFFIFFPKRKVFLLSYIVHILNKILAFILGVKVRVSGHKELLKERGVFFVINHLSYIDGIIASSLSPLIFIGRSDLKNWPLFGVLSRLSCTIFVDRINASNIHKELQMMKSILRQKTNIILFPEGTSGDGKKLLSFKSSFFAAPLETQCRIVPLAIKYIKINSEDINDRNKDLVYWYGDMEFMPHLTKVLSLRKIEVEVGVSESLQISDTQIKSPSFNRKYLSDMSYEVIERCLNPEEIAA